jgi:hypothetical protein
MSGKKKLFAERDFRVLLDYVKDKDFLIAYRQKNEKNT